MLHRLSVVLPFSVLLPLAAQEGQPVPHERYRSTQGWSIDGGTWSIVDREGAGEFLERWQAAAEKSDSTAAAATRELLDRVRAGAAVLLFPEFPPDFESLMRVSISPGELHVSSFGDEASARELWDGIAAKAPKESGIRQTRRGHGLVNIDGVTSIHVWGDMEHPDGDLQRYHVWMVPMGARFLVAEAWLGGDDRESLERATTTIVQSIGGAAPAPQREKWWKGYLRTTGICCACAFAVALFHRYRSKKTDANRRAP